MGMVTRGIIAPVGNIFIIAIAVLPSQSLAGQYCYGSIITAIKSRQSLIDVT